MRKLLVASCAFVASCMVFTGCSLFQKPDSEDPKVAVPTEFKLSSKGVLSWTEVEGATAYEIVFGDQVTTVEKTSQDLFALVTSAGDYSVSVSAVGGESATYEFKAVQLGTPTTPVIEEDPDTHAVKYVWQGDENTRSYAQEVNGNGKWITNTENYYEITATGSYTISVKAKAYASKNVLYLESPASETSAVYEYKQGPVLQLAGMAVIDWTIADGDEYDSYNLWINGVKVKEDVQKTDEGYALTGGEDPAITKTGEYNVQLEAVQGDYSYWSNVLVEVGTYNINEGEIYSFDNRVYRVPVAKEGFEISNEQYHGDSGYSLRFESTRSEQINLVKYADGTANDIDLTTVRTISYWVYIEPIDGVDGNFPASDLPAPKWEKAWSGTYKQQPFNATESVPYGEWTKVTIENVQNAYDNVLILQYAKTIEQDCVIYVDDITYDAIWEDVTKDGAEYEVEFTASASRMGSWQAFDATEIDFGAENANTTLTVTMDVCGTVPAGAQGTYGIFYDIAKDAGPTDACNFEWIETAKISTLDTWSTISFKVKTDANGKTYLAGAYKQDAGKVLPFSIFIKGVQIAVAEVGGTAMPTGTSKTDVTGGYYQSVVGFASSYEVGTTVKVEMSIYVTGEFDEYSYIKWVDTVWTTDGGEINAEGEVMTSAQMTENLGKWTRVSFYATVREFDVLRMNSAYPTMDVSAIEKGVYLVAANFLEDKSFNYKDVVIVNENDTNPGVAMLTGTKSKTNGYYQAFGVLDTDLEVGTTVTVTMEIKVTGTHDEWGGEIRWVGSVWTTDGGEVNAEPLILDVRTLSASDKLQWVRVTFEATVCKFDVLRANNQQFDTMDVSTEGNGIYLFAKNFTSAESFNYRNVEIKAKV